MASVSQRFSIIVLIVFPLFFKYGVSILFHRFGCDFLDSNYKEPNDSSVFTPIYGQPVEPLELELIDLQVILHRLEKISEEILEDHRYNEVDGYIQLFNDFKASSSKNFPQFFENYEAPFRPLEVNYGFVIEVLNRLVDDVKQVDPKHVYLGTVHLEAPKSYIEFLEDVGEIPKYFVHGSVVGVIRISVENNTGYIITDSGSAIATPVVLFDDGKKPFKNFNQKKIEDIYGTKFTYTWMKDSLRKFVVSTFEGRDRKTFKKISKSNVIYMDQPFCSPIQVTAKLGLLSGHRAILKTNKAFHTTACLDFELNSQDSFMFFTVSVYTNSIMTSTYNVPFSVINSPNISDIPQFTNARKHLGYSHEELMGKLENLKALSENKFFLKGTETVSLDLAEKRNTMLLEHIERFKKMYREAKQNGQQESKKKSGMGVLSMLLGGCINSRERDTLD